MCLVITFRPHNVKLDNALLTLAGVTAHDQGYFELKLLFN